MAWPIESLSEHLAIAGLVLVRIAALVLVAPLIGPFEVSLRMRAAMALALTLLVAPLEIGRATAMPDSLAGFLTAAGGEALVGLLLGLGVRILFASLHLAGGLISQMSGLQLAEVFSPGMGTSVPVFSQLLLLVTTAVFLIVGGHRQLVEALLDTFHWLPAGQAAQAHSPVAAVTALVAQSFILVIRIAAPAVVALLLATLIVGFVSRTLPQLNIMALGFGINALVAIAAVGLSLSGACWVFQEQLQPFVETALRTFQ
jgi:flagellar biosynthesis protein FliR